MKKNMFVNGALTLIIFNLIGKVIGGVYRIPLAKIVGSVGMGQYQLTFPLYCLILTISTSGIPVAISKMVAEYNSRNRFYDSKKLLRVSVVTLSIISFLSALVLVLGARFISALQGNPDAYICYYGIAPAILFVGVLSAYRGYFQGNLLMFPTAISGFVEQVVKLGAGLFLAVKFLEFGTEYAVFGALLGVSVSEFFAFLFLLVCYLFHSKKHCCLKTKESYSYRFLTSQMFNLAVPITMGGLIAPLTSMVDSFLVVNLLIFTGFSGVEATTLLGVQSGVVEPLVNIPVIISVSISTALLPNLSGLNTLDEKEKVKLCIEKAFQISMSISVACFVCFIIFGEQALSFLYGSSFDFYELQVAEKLLFLGAINIVFLSLVQVSSGCLQGLGKQKEPVKALLIGGVVKIVLDVVLVMVKALNIYGAVISAGACYLVVLVFNYRKIKQITGASLFGSYFHISIQACFVCLFAFVSNTLFKMIFGDVISMFLAGVLAIIVFMVTYYVFFMIKEKPAESMHNLT